MGAKITICVPVYNVENYIERCLKSILAQTFQDFEVLLVDDCSKDNSINIARSYQQLDKRIRIIQKEQNEGLMMARRTGYLLAQAQYIMFCDSDDFMPPNALEKLFEKAQTTNSDIVVGNVTIEYENGGTRFVERASKAHNLDSYRKALLTGTLCTLCGILYKTSLFQNYKYATFLNHNFSEDRILLSQLLDKATSITSINATSYIYYLNKNSMTQNRLTHEKLKEQAFALSWCHEWNKRHQKLEFLNHRWFLRYISFYIESGYNIKDFLDNSQYSSKFLSFKSIKKYCGLRFAIHTYLCEKFKPYQIVSSKSRLIIRNLRNFMIG